MTSKYSFSYTPPSSARSNEQVGTAISRGARSLDDQNELRVFKTRDPNVLRAELTFRSFAEGLDLMTITISPGAFTGKLAKVEGLDARKGRLLTLAAEVVRTSL